ESLCSLKPGISNRRTGKPDPHHRSPRHSPCGPSQGYNEAIMSNWTRRALILATAAAAAPVVAFAAGKLWCHIKFTTRTQLSAFYHLMAMYVDPDAMAALGKLYLHESASTALNALERLQATESLRRAISTGCVLETMRAVQQACREDFCAGRIHCVGGWVLAQTELDVAAL